MNRFKNCTNYKEISNAINIANSLLMAGSKMIEEIYSKNDWEYNSGRGNEIALKLLVYREPISILTYRPWNPLSKVIGYYDGETININLRKLPYMAERNIISNLVHEYSHACGFSHGSNFPSDHKNKFSVPYFLSHNINQGKWL